MIRNYPHARADCSLMRPSLLLSTDETLPH